MAKNTGFEYACRALQSAARAWESSDSPCHDAIKYFANILQNILKASPIKVIEPEAPEDRIRKKHPT
jgi:hypothetical protein